MLASAIPASPFDVVAMNIQEPARDIPVIHEVDLCILGGSTTGVFAAVAAARLKEKH